MARIERASARRGAPPVTSERASAPGPGPRVAIDLLLALACAGLALWVHRGALAVYFHPDDLISMEWARGILPAPDFGPWRLISGRLFFAAALEVFGTNPFAYHLLNAVLHVANVVLLYALCRRWGASTAAATLAAGLFGTARPAFSVLQQAVGIGELLALGLAMAALLLCERRTIAARTGAVALLLAAVLSKEGVLPLPLALLLPREPGSWARSSAWRGRLAVAGPALLASAAAGAALVVAHVRERAFGSEAYAMGFGTNLFHNLMTYVAWAFDVRNPFFDDPGRISPEAWHVGLPVLTALVALAWGTRRRTLLPIVGLAWAALTIAPVVPLLYHTYATYLYAPLAGVGLALATGLEALVRSVPASRRRHRGRDGARESAHGNGPGLAMAAMAVVLLIAHAANSNWLLDARVARRVQGLDVPFDRQLRKSEMVRRAAEGLRRSSTGTPKRIVIYMPAEASSRLDQRAGVVFRDTTIQLEQMLMYRVLDGGRALQALSPGLDSVAFVQRWTGEYADFDLCANSPAGDVVDFGRGPDAHLKLGQLLLQGGYAPLAVDHLTEACKAYAEDARLRQMLARAQAASRPR